MAVKVIVTAGALVVKGSILEVDPVADTLTLGVGKVRGAHKVVRLSRVTKVIPTREEAA